MRFGTPASVALVVTLCLIPGALSLWPQPGLMTQGDGARAVASDFSISIPPSYKDDDDLQQACQRALSRVNLLPIKLYSVDRGASFAAKVRQSKPLSQLRVDVGEQGSEVVTWNKEATNQSVIEAFENQRILFQKRASTPKSISSLILQPLEKLDESYSLAIPSDGGVAVLKADSALGALRGLATFAQLVYRLPDQDGHSGGRYIPKLPIDIRDKPSFPYRGIMIDTARNLLPAANIKKALDAMEVVKLNQLHWHVTDSQSWPLELKTKGLNVLAEKGAYGPVGSGLTYSRAAVQDIIDYAGKRGVNVVMEFDMPGHMNAGVRDYPGELIACDDKDDWSHWAAEPPSGHLDIRKPAATQFVKDLFSEVSTFHKGLYISTGNDEVQPHCYGLAKDDKAGTDKLLAPFVDAVHSHLVSLNKVPVVWEEAALDFPETAKVLKAGTLVEAWTSSANVQRLLQATDKIRIIHAPVDFFYLDCGLGGWLSNSATGQSWCNFVTWQKQYSFDPFSGTENVTGGRERVMGGESPLWAEQVDSANFDSLLWPRAASGAEVFWTGATFTLDGKEQKRTLSQADHRMHEIRGRIRAMGIQAAPLQPLWCALRPGRCQLQ